MINFIYILYYIFDIASELTLQYTDRGWCRIDTDKGAFQYAVLLHVDNNNYNKLRRAWE